LALSGQLRLLEKELSLSYPVLYS